MHKAGIVSLVLLLFVSLTAYAEDARVPYPSGGNLIDITDKVTISGPETIQFESWEFEHEVPTAIANAAKVCSGKTKMDSYPDGSMLPTRNYYINSSDEEVNHDYVFSLIGKKLNSRYFNYEFCSYARLSELIRYGLTRRYADDCLAKFRNVPLSMSYMWRQESEYVEYLLSCNELKLKVLADNDWMCIRTGNKQYLILIFKQFGSESPDPPYMNRITHALLCDYTTGKTEVKEISSFPNHDFITRWGREPYGGYANCQEYDSFLLLNKINRKLELYGKGATLTKTFDMFDRQFINLDIWHAPQFHKATVFPNMLVFEDNFGIERETLLPSYANKGSMNPEPDGSRWQAHFRTTDKASRRTYLYNVETGTAQLMCEGLVFNPDLVDSRTVRVSNVVKQGKVGYSFIRSGREAAFLPYDTFIPAEYVEYLDSSRIGDSYHVFDQCLSPYANSECVLGSGSYAVVDYNTMTVSRLKSEVQLDTAAFPPRCHDDVIALVSTEFTNDNNRFRQILLLSGKNAKHPYRLLRAVTVPSGLLPVKEKQSFAWVTERGLEIVVNSSRAYLVKGVTK